MSVDTATDLVATEAEAVESVEKTAPVLPTIPGDDSDLKGHGSFLDRIRDLLTNANALPDSQDDLTQRAFTLAVSAMTLNNPGAVKRERVLMHVKPVADDSERGHSQRFHYPAQRARLLMTIAHELGVAAELTFRTYAYSGTRKQYTVELFGAEQDVARVQATQRALDARILDEIAKIEFAPSDNAGKQTKIKREHVLASAQLVGEQLAKIVASNEKAAKIRETRLAKAEIARQEWINTPA